MKKELLKTGEIATGFMSLQTARPNQSSKTKPKLQDPIKDPARLQWHAVKKVDHYYLSIDAVTQPMQVKEKSVPYGDPKK
jgi:hypothetical protein